MVETKQGQAASRADNVKALGCVVSGETVVGYAILGCLAAGTIGVLKAICMDGVGAGACLLASAAAFGTVCYVYYRWH